MAGEPLRRRLFLLAAACIVPLAATAGIALLARHGRRLPFMVALTGYGLPEDRARALASGFDEHLTKPVDADTLARVLARRAA
jgi:CheY-like chemotaxis protein